MASHKDISSTHNQFTGINSLSVPGVGGLITSLSTPSICSGDSLGSLENENAEEDDYAGKECDISGSGHPAPLSLLDVDAPVNYNYGERRRSRAILYQLSATYSGNQALSGPLGDASNHRGHDKKMALYSKLTGTQVSSRIYFYKDFHDSFRIHEIQNGWI